MAKSFKYSKLQKAESLIDSALNLASRQPHKCLRFQFEIVNSKAALSFHGELTGIRHYLPPIGCDRVQHFLRSDLSAPAERCETKSW
jgi:hypothetical protein